MFGREKSDVIETLPMVPLRDVVVFPHMMIPFVIGRPASVKALEIAFNGDKRIFLATQHDASIDDPKPSEIYVVGTIANIVQSLRLPDGNIKVLVEGVERAKAIQVYDEDHYLKAVLRPAPIAGSMTSDLAWKASTVNPSDAKTSDHELIELNSISLLNARRS